jgi:hypothetical protein
MAKDLTVNLDTSQRVNITCRKGDTFNLEVTFKDEEGSVMDLSGYEWKMDVRDDDVSPTTILNDTEFVYSANESGTLTISASANTMAGVNGGVYVYDLQSTNAGAVKTWLRGRFRVNEDVTE